MAKAATLATLFALVHVAPGWAHGPCGTCLSRFSGPPGGRVTITDTTAYRVVWNGRGLPQDGALGPLHRRDAATIELVRHPLPARRGVEFTVPDVAEGSYPVVIYDGSESGFHYTFDLFRVTRPEQSRWPAVAGAGLAAAAILLGAYGARRLKHLSARDTTSV